MRARVPRRAREHTGCRYTQSRQRRAAAASSTSSQRSIITLVVALAAGAGCSKNSKEALDRAHEAAEAQCDCVAGAMNKPRSQIGHNDCDATKTAFFSAMESVDQSEKQGEEVWNLGYDCIKELSELSRPPTDSN